MAQKKDAYSNFKAKLSEENFRRYWGGREETMIAAMEANRLLAELTKDRKEKREYTKEADRLYNQASILGDVFMSLEMFRIGGQP